MPAIIGDIVVFFKFVVSIDDSYDVLELTSSMISVTSTASQLKLVYATSFLLLGQLRDLPR